MNVKSNHMLNLERVKSLVKNGVLKAKDAKDLLKELSCAEDDLCELLVDVAKSYSIAPISEFYVGAVIQGQTGNYYLGANYEFCESFLNQSIHAEQSRYKCILPR